jgi:hypothetical protein
MSSDPTFLVLGEGSLVMFFLLCVFVLSGSFLEKKKSPVGHETGVVILIGLVISYIFYAED